jgi:hypothetical protein
VLTFFFSDQLKGIESAGFDVANFFPDAIASFDPARESSAPPNTLKLNESSGCT